MQQMAYSTGAISAFSLPEHIHGTCTAPVAGPPEAWVHNLIALAAAVSRVWVCLGTSVNFRVPS